MTTPFGGRGIEHLPALCDQRRFDALGIGDQALQTGLEMQQHQLRIELETEGVAERRLDRETAEIVADGLTPRPSIVETPALTPDEAPTSILRALEPYRRTKAVALVGHEPGIGRLAAWLLSTAEPVEFKKGGVCCIESASLPPDGRGRLVWHATPAMLRALAE